MTRISFFDAHRYDRAAFDAANRDYHFDITYLDARLTRETAPLVQGCRVVCSFVNDRLDKNTLESIYDRGIRLIALRSAGFNHVDLESAERLGLPVVRVPQYSPYAVAEHAVALVLNLSRKVHRAHARVRDGNFSLEGLVGFDLHGKTVGLIGTGQIGAAAARIFLGFGCKVQAFDLQPDPGLTSAGVQYVPLVDLYRSSEIISLHVPLTPTTHHMLDGSAFSLMKAGVMVVNTGRGALIDTSALLNALKTGHVGYAGLDVYEEEEGIFFQDLSDRVLQDDLLARLLTFPNVLITSHQAFLTREALDNIARTTLDSIAAFERGEPLRNAVRAREVLRR